jgi:hypothetical protein
MKNAQSTQVYVIVGVIFFFGVVLGFKLIYDFLQTSSDVRLMELQTRLRSDSEVARMKPGSVAKYSYSLPYQTDQVCFYDNSSRGAAPADPLVKTMLEEGKNVFLIGKLKTLGIKVEHLKAPSRYYCIKVNGNSVELFLEGQGSYALVREV